MASKVRPLPAKISPASIERGDVIRVIWSVGNVRRTIEGKVGKREYENNMRVFTADDGQELLRWHPELKTNQVVLLIKKTEQFQGETMLDMFEQEGRL